MLLRGILIYEMSEKGCLEVNAEYTVLEMINLSRSIDKVMNMMERDYSILMYLDILSRLLYS